MRRAMRIRLIKSLASVAALLLLSAPSLCMQDATGNSSQSQRQGASAESQSQAEKEVLALDEQFEDAFKRGDISREEMLADDYVGIGVGSTVYSKTTSRDLYKSGRIKTLDHHVTERKIRVYGDTALVTAMRHIQDTFDGKPRDEYHRYTRIWARRSGKWQIVSFQATKIDDGPLQTAGFEACSAPDAPVPAGSIEETILKLQEEHSQASRQGDPEKGTGWLSDDYIGINGRGRISDKRAVTELYKPGSLKYRVEKYSHKHVRLFGNTAILTGTWCFRQLREGDKEELTSANRITRVWLKRNGKWEVVSWQGTPVPPQNAASVSSSPPPH